MLVTGVSKKGGRAVNEDAYGETRADGILCAVAADGLGGHYGGQVASRLAVDTILEEFSAAPEFSTECAEELVKAANAAIVARAENDPQIVHMSTTITLLMVQGRRALWAHVGDSRIYHLEYGRIQEVTEDHSLAFARFMDGEIEYNDIRSDGDQNKLINALGIGFKGVDVSEITRIGPNAAFLLCTDGWWEYVTEAQIENSYKATGTTRSWIKAMMDIRESAAPEGSDNYTAVAVMI